VTPAASAASTPAGPALAHTTCLDRLASYGIGVDEASSVDWAVSWFGPARVEPGRRGSEAAVQAMSGLATVNGWDDGHPRRIGLEIASVGAGVLAAVGVLASLVGRARGRPDTAVRTSALQAALLQGSHYIAAATSGDEPWPVPALADPAPGPPFRTSDGFWFEMDTLDADVWRAFWLRLGVPDADLGPAWGHFRPRYFRGRCALPASLHQTTARYALSELSRLAGEYGVSLCPLRIYSEVLVDLHVDDAHPSLDPLAPSGPLSGAPAPSGVDSPLAGLVVVEATTRMQGPLATLLLQMLGAEVVKVEPPGGDVGRMVAPLADGTGSFFRCWNRGKNAVEVDLTTTSGRDQLAEIVRGADVFLHNWRPGKAQEWALGPEDLSAHRPGLVYAQASGWGQRPDRKDVLGLDFLVQAFAGFGEALTPPGERPRTSRVLLTDFMGALVTCEGILGALYGRCGDGQGRLVGSSLLAGALTLESHVLAGLRARQEVGRRGGRPRWDLLDRPLETVDGAVVVSVESDDDLALLGEVCGVKPDRGGRSALAKAVAEHFAGDRADGLCARLVAAGLPAAVVAGDLAVLPEEAALSNLFEPVSATCRVPVSPWSTEP
jgi:crotonobetainyl-CoA:carnitine CoA-transferase CaiB-like acyl-CoA transferase